MSAGGIEELVIPVRFDSGSAAADLKKVEAAGHAAGNGTAQGFDQAKRSAGGLGSEIGGLIKAQMGLTAIKQVATAMGDEFRRAADYVKHLAMEFADVRHAMQQVAALRGEQNSDKFTLKQVEKGASAGLTPEEWQQAQEGFLNPAAAQISEPGKGLEPGKKMTAEQAEEYQLRVAAALKSKGIRNLAPGMEFAGSILEQSKGPLSVEQAMGQFNKGFEVLQRGRISPERGPGMMSEGMAQGLSAQEAATALSVVAPAAPGEESASLTGALRAVEEMRVTGKGKQFGVTDQMSKYEALKAFGKNIGERERALKAQGKNDNEIEVEIARQLKQADVASEIRERRGLVRGIYHQGIELGGFENYERIGNETAPDADRAAVAEYQKSDQGRAAQRRADQRAAEVRRGILQQPATEELEKAKVRVTERGDLERGRAENLYRGAIGTVSGVSPEQQIVNEEAIRELRTKAYDLGIRQDSSGEIGKAPWSNEVWTGDVRGRDQQSVNDEIKDLLKQIADATRKSADQKEGGAPAQVAPPAIGRATPPALIPRARGGARQ